MSTRARMFRPPYALLAVLLLLPAAGCREDAVRPPEGDPPFTPEEALRTFELADGFQIELVAAEPLVADPVAMEIDENGQFYVVEMHGYPMDKGGSGKVKLLRDTDGDGRPDTSIAFAEGLTLPTGIMRWKKGVLVTDAPDVLYLEDTDGDGKADVKRVVLTGFALSNPQHNVNTPLYGLDNWIYLAHEPAVATVQFQEQFGDRGREIVFPDRADAPTLPVNANGRNVRFRPDTYELEATASRTQFGHTFDAWGHQLLVNNANHGFHEVLAARYLRRNPDLLVTSTTHSYPDHGSAAEVFPITKNPEHQLLTDVGVFTSACGITAYLGGAFPAPYGEAVFVAEPVHNLVHVDRLADAGATFTASRMSEGKEFLASTDGWFRPVNFYVGPDGALYVLDYYRQIIEHPEWMSDEVIQSGALYNGVDRGRIYRITPKRAARFSGFGEVRLGQASDEELVRALESSNIWHRRTAQRLLVDRRSAGAVAALAALARESDAATARVHALWTLEGLGALEPALLSHALGDEAAGVRENAVRLAELHLKETPALAARLVAMQDDQNEKVRFQLVSTLGELDSPEAQDVRQKLLFAGIEDEWMQMAALSASTKQEAALLRQAVAQLAGRETPARRTFFRRVNSIIGARQEPGPVREVIGMVSRTNDPGASWWRAASLEGLAAGLRGSEGRPSGLAAEQGMILDLFWNSDSSSVRTGALALLEVLGLPSGAKTSAALRQAATVARDAGADPARRADAVRLLAQADASAHMPLLQQLVDPREPAPVQKAAVQAMGTTRGDQVATFLLGRWEQLTPDVRDEAIGVLVADQERIPLLLDAIERRTVQTSSIGWRRSVRLMLNRDDALRERARVLLTADPGAGEEAVQRYRAAVTTDGDAARGEKVYARACALCHQIGGAAGTPFGPDLGTIRSRRAEALLSDILIPGQSIADGYEQWAVERKGGETVYGVIANETPTAITLRSGPGNEVVIARGDIESMTASNISAMPAGLEQQISVEEMADLLAFLKRNRS